ncbi:MAG: helix-turn-helix domain-containing protein [Flavobacteriaceae bacterium]|nr:helix-turn-helix domain-containing protein [Flavobacteriaceae bacterium]
MAANIITTEDLMDFKSDLLDEIKEIVINQSGVKIKKWMKSKEVRELLSVSAGTLQTLRINGTLPYSKIGGVIYYDYSEIVKVFEEHKIHNKY